MCRVKDAISLDHLSRLLADVQTDSSEVMEAFVSPAQRQMLELVYRGDAENRNKVLIPVPVPVTLIAPTCRTVIWTPSPSLIHLHFKLHAWIPLGQDSYLQIAVFLFGCDR